MRVTFGECTFDSETRQLHRRGREVHLEPKAFRLLELLLASRPRVVTRAELEDRLWPDVFVSRGSLGRVVSGVRAAMGDRARTPCYIRTVHGVGYAFSASAAELREEPVDSSSPSGSVCLLWGARVIVLIPGENVLGRSPESTAVVNAVGVSREHARLLVANGAAEVEDRGSKNGTYVNRRRIDAPTPLVDGDELTIGTAVMTLRVASARGVTDTLP